MFKERLRKFPVTLILTEVFSVILAVLVALAANEWRTSRANKELAENALKNIYQEIKTNQKEITESLGVHKVAEKNLAEIVDAIKSKSSSKDSLINALRFSYSHSVLTQTAWNSAIITQAVKFMDYQTIEKLSTIYELQNFYARHGQQIFAGLGSVAYHAADEQAVMNVNLINIRLTINIEENLLEEYDMVMNEK